MQTFTANEAKTHFGEFIDKAQKEPVRVTRRGRTVGIMVSESDYEAMREYYTDRLLHTMDRAGEQARQAGLTEENLDALLSDES